MLTQVAVAWVLGTVFVRCCEDNQLIPEPYLTGAETERRDLVEARYAQYVDEDADPTYRGWLERAFTELGSGQAGNGYQWVTLAARSTSASSLGCWLMVALRWWLVLPKRRVQPWELLWPNRIDLQRRVDFGQTPAERRLRWFDHSMFFPKRYRTPLSITFAEVATHNHFALDRGGRVFKQTAPVVKLKEGASEDDHLRLIGLLNSSTACLWLKLNCHDKGIRGEGGEFTSSDWERFYQFNSGNVERFPIPSLGPIVSAAALDALVGELTAASPSALTESGTPTAPCLRQARARWESTRSQMIALQEELDWQVYSLYKLHSEDLRAPEDDVPELALGERAFEIVLARRVEKGEASGEWFKRHNSTPITTLPDQ